MKIMNLFRASLVFSCLLLSKAVAAQESAPTSPSARNIVIVGTKNTILTSQDGMSWANQSLKQPIYVSINSVSWNGNQFVATANDSPSTTFYTLTSPDGTNWTYHILNSSIQGDHIFWSNNQYWSSGSSLNTLNTSSDGINWQSTPLPKAEMPYVVYTQNNKFIAFSSTCDLRGFQICQQGSPAGGAIATSDDGKNWQVVAQAMPYIMQGIAYAKNQYVIAAINIDFLGTLNGSGVLVSQDNKNWTWHPINGGSKLELTSIATNGHIFVAVGKTADFPSTAVAYASVDGINWIQQTLPQSRYDGIGLVKVTWVNNIFVAVNGDSGNIYTSSDGIHWAQHDSQISSVFSLNDVG